MSSKQPNVFLNKLTNASYDHAFALNYPYIFVIMKSSANAFLLPDFFIGKFMVQLDGIKHKWANSHFDDFETKSRCSMKYTIKRINTN